MNAEKVAQTQETIQRLQLTFQVLQTLAKETEHSSTSSISFNLSYVAKFIYERLEQEQATLRRLL